jgi:small subunit ribosomal protein S20
MLPRARRQAGICVSLRRESVANSKQQAKRVRTAARQRLENLRYRTQIKTLFRRLDEAVEAGDSEQIDTAHRRLVALVDRAAARRAIHRNAAAHRKSRAARIVSRTNVSA